MTHTDQLGASPSVAGSTVIVTSTRRIGGAIARELLAAGAAVCVFHHQSAGEAASLVDEAERQGAVAHTVKADLSTAEGCHHAVNRAAAWRGTIDSLVNVASRYERVSLAQVNEEAWDRALNVDLSGTWWACQAALPWLRASPRGRIVNFADWVAASRRPRYLGYLPYYVAKCGVIALTEALALELAEAGVLVNCIAPGPIVPPSGTASDNIMAIAQETPLGRWGGERTVARTVRALLESDFMTGETIRVDGGRHLR